MADPSSSSNCLDVAVKHWDWQVEPEFETKRLNCSVTLKATTQTQGVAHLVLDTSDLSVSSVVDATNGKELHYELKETVGAFGKPLYIALPSNYAAVGSDVVVTITYETSPSCSAVQWLEPAQTDGKKHPYLFTQCQPIHARSMIPCQDTPSIKTTFTAEVISPSELTALMSGERLGCAPHPTKPGKVVFRFQQKIPTPSYLIALVVGALESRRVGPRSHVWSEPKVVEKAAWEFEETEKMLQAAEEVVGEYVWGQYDILVLPPSFPYGGMENPCLTFVSPTTVAGDRSLTSVVAHEITHSWIGNLVTNKTWEQFWLNEGITTYVERRIIAKLYGEKERHLLYIGGWRTLEDAIDRFDKENKHSLTALVPNLRGIHPDDAFSSIPYEKGSTFLYYLDTLLGGPGSLDKFLKAYVTKFKFGTVTTKDWKEFFLSYFHKEAAEGVFDHVDWDSWFYNPGMPPYIPKYDTSLADASAALADRWAVTEVTATALAQFSSQDLNQMSSKGVQEFLNQLLSKPPLPLGTVQAMDKVYNLSKVENAEVKFRWLKLCLRSKWSDSFPLVTTFVTSQGRMKFVRPLYKDLFNCSEEGRDIAISTFQANKSFYHSVAATQLAKDLELQS